MSVVLETKGIVKRFGGITATDGVSITVEQGARHALIGPNGAGKTTLINLLTGVLSPTSGTILMNGVDITRLSPERRVKLGLARTFQINQLFAGLTPLESLALAINEREGHGHRWWKSVGHFGAVETEACQLAQQFRLTDVLTSSVASMPYGKQRQLEIALSIACRPKVLLLDEPAAGVPEAERQELLESIAALPASVTVLLIEHDMDIVFRFATRISVLVNGAMLAEGTPDEMAAAPRVKAAYLGESIPGDSAHD